MDILCNTTREIPRNIWLLNIIRTTGAWTGHPSWNWLTSPKLHMYKFWHICPVCHDHSAKPLHYLVGLSYREGWVLVSQRVGTTTNMAAVWQEWWTRTPQGESIKFYRLPRDTEAQAAYTRILQTTGINWHSGHICAEYWSRGYRENASADFPDVPVPASQLVALQKKAWTGESSTREKGNKACQTKSK